MQTPLRLEPRIEGFLADLLNETEALADLVSSLGSPLNVVLPDRIEHNLEAFRRVLDHHRLRGQVFYAHKANRSCSFVRRLAATGASIDVASLGELQRALSCGFVPSRIMVTGPKNPELLWLAARCGVTVNVDGPAEVETLAGLVAKHGLPPVRVLLRLSGFAGPGVTVLSRPSRFGTPMAEVQELIELMAGHRELLDLVGTAYHLDTISLSEKALAFEACFTVMNDCQSRGLSPRILDIGGGFGADYLAGGEQWERYTTELTRAVMGSREPLTWGGHSYGLRMEGGKLRGSLGLYPAHRPLSGPAYLDRLLAQNAPIYGRPLGTLLLEHMYELHLEPGRALVDQCGLVLVRVLSVRHSRGELLVGLEANAGDISLEEHGVLMDPLLLSPGGDPAPVDGDQSEPVGVYLLGNLCLEADLITRRKVFLPRLPRPGDLLAFVNTAGYLMDFNAGHALDQPVARTVAAFRNGRGWRWRLDDQYWPEAATGARL